MSRKLDEFLKSPFITEKRKEPKPGEQVGDDKDDKQKIEIYDRIHAYVFVFDSSNKKTFDNMMCVIETILELIKSKQRSAQKDKPPFIPKMLCLGNKWDLRENKSKGELKKKDIISLQDNMKIRVKFVSALKNYEIKESMKILITDLHNDQQLTKSNKDQIDKINAKLKQEKADKKKDDENEQEETKDDDKDKKQSIKNPDATDNGGGCFGCCGPRKDEEETDSDEPKDEQEEDEGDNAETEDKAKEKVSKREIKLIEDDSREMKEQKKELRRLHGGEVQDQGVESEKKECIIF